MRINNVSFKANYLTDPSLLQKNTTTMPPRLNAIINKDTYNGKTTDEEKNKKILYCAYLMAGAALVIAGLSLMKSKNIELSLSKLFRNKSTGAYTPAPQTNAVSFGGKEFFRGEMWQNLSEAPSLSELSLSDDLAELAQKTLRVLKNPSLIKKRGGNVSNSILLYGPPGTGKTTFAKALAKELPGAKFASVDIAALGSEYHSVTERNLNAVFDEICEAARTFKDKKIFVFFDEIDSIMMVDPGTSAKRSNDILNVFKKGLTEKFAKLENIVVLGATNLTLDEQTGRIIGGKQLDKPMLDRFKNKIFVGLPTKEQIHGAIVKHYQNGACELVEEGMKDIASPKLKILSEFLAKHKISFRTLEGLYQEAATTVKDDTAKLSIFDFINAIKSKAVELKINLKDIDALIERLKN